MNHKEALELLGFNEADKPESNEIDKAFRKKAKDVHPDKNGGSLEATESFKNLNAARELLQCPQEQAHVPFGGDFIYRWSETTVSFQAFFNTFFSPEPGKFFDLLSDYTKSNLKNNTQSKYDIEFYTINIAAPTFTYQTEFRCFNREDKAKISSVLSDTERFKLIKFSIKTKLKLGADTVEAIFENLRKTSVRVIDCPKNFFTAEQRRVLDEVCQRNIQLAKSFTLNESDKKDDYHQELAFASGMRAEESWPNYLLSFLSGNDWANRDAFRAGRDVKRAESTDEPKVKRIKTS